jgi:uncharacterized membrane protein
MIDAEFILGLVARWAHILAAIGLMGGALFARVAAIPAADALPADARESFHEAARRRWLMVVMLCIALLLASGIYNFVVILRFRLHDDLKAPYHAMFGIKFLLALVIFFVASALVGRSSALEPMRRRRRLWLTVNLWLALVLVCLSGALRLMRDARPVAPPAAAGPAALSAPDLSLAALRAATAPDVRGC